MKPVSQEPLGNDQRQAARQLWYGTYQGVLSTHSKSQAGYPFGSLVPICRDHEGKPLLLLSHLAQHTQNLNNNPNCSLMLFEQGSGDVQQLARLTCTAQSEKLKTVPEHLAQRYFRYFPDTQEYYERLNFRFYRLHPQRCYFVAGFGAVRWIDPSRLLAELVLSANEEIELLSQLVSYPPFTEPTEQTSFPLGLDSLGLDIRTQLQRSRLMFAEPVVTPNEILEKLIKVLRVYCDASAQSK